MSDFPPVHKNFPCIVSPVIPPLPKRLRQRKTASPATWRRKHWDGFDDEAAALLSPDGVRLYEAEKAMLWRFGYSWTDARETLRLSLMARYVHEIKAGYVFVSEGDRT